MLQVINTAFLCLIFLLSPGVCLCAEGWLGPDCSVDVTSGPRVANLANNGLCDVRSKPCRSIIVFGDNFAASEKLVCHFEVFKVGSGIHSNFKERDTFTERGAGFKVAQNTLM